MKTLPRVSSGSCQNMTRKMNSYKLSSCEVMCVSPFIRIHKYTCELSCSSEKTRLNGFMNCQVQSQITQILSFHLILAWE